MGNVSLKVLKKCLNFLLKKGTILFLLNLVPQKSTKLRKLQGKYKSDHTKIIYFLE